MSAQRSLLLLIACASAYVASASECEVRARTTAGWVCGEQRWSHYGGMYYNSFRGVPYAKQPLGELRFKELEPPEPWEDDFDATNEGDICPQTDVFYGRMMKPRGMSESCIHANIHVPIISGGEEDAELVYNSTVDATGLPILVFIHGGGFAFGSGDSDVYGPEYLVSNGIIVITFNYRLNVFGFLSLNTSKIPGNNGLRDMITLLRWVRDNARAFGGDPYDVTIGGQSAGAASAHLLTLATEAHGLFKRAILMSGTALPTFFTTTPKYAEFAANSLLNMLGIKTKDKDEVHRLLVNMPLDVLMTANRMLLDSFGLAVFFPVVESSHPGVKQIIPADPITLLDRGYGNHIPLMIGFTDVEAESFRKRFQLLGMEKRVAENPTLLLSPTVTFSMKIEEALARVQKVKQKYFKDLTVNMDSFVKLATDQYFKYPALKVAHYRARAGRSHAPAYVYQFAYDAAHNPMRVALGLDYTGAAHMEDMTYIFGISDVSVRYNEQDQHMKWLMTNYFVNFMRYGHPGCYQGKEVSWRPVGPGDLSYLDLQSPTERRLVKPTANQTDMVAFFDDILGWR